MGSVHRAQWVPPLDLAIKLVGHTFALNYKFENLHFTNQYFTLLIVI